MNDFQYLQPDSVKEAAGWLADGNGAALPNGAGTDLLDLMKEGIATPRALVNLKKLPDLNRIEQTREGLRIGALVTLAEIAADRHILERYTVLAEAASKSASPQLRNVGTLGGNLGQQPRCWYYRSASFPCLRKGGDTCFAVVGEHKRHAVVGYGDCIYVHPSDPAVALVALDASVEVQGPKKSRTVKVKDLYVLPEDDPTRELVLEPGEIITHVIVPEPPRGTVSGYLKFMERESWDFAVVSVAAVIQRDGGTIAGGRIALGGVAPAPWLEKNVSDRLAGTSGSDASLEELASHALADADPLEQNAFKLPLARNLIRRKLGELMA